MRAREATDDTAIGYASELIRDVCAMAGEPDLIERARMSLAEEGILDAVARHDDGVLFGWLLEAVSYQGVSDRIALGYMERHGTLGAKTISRALQEDAVRCPKLASYWRFDDCGYRKATRWCSRPDLIEDCPLPRHSLRNGRLNQTAYSLFLFLRDVAGGDFVGWLDAKLVEADAPKSRDRGHRLAEAIVRPLAGIYGVSDKVLSMSLSAMLLTASPERERWRVAGTAMIAVDTLVHNWMHRTGILKKLKADHLYGPDCHRLGCARIIRDISGRIDARAFNPAFPRNFPRFVQHAIWRFCSQSGLGQCNGNTIDDSARCGLNACPLFDRCARVKLQPPAG